MNRALDYIAPVAFGVAAWVYAVFGGCRMLAWLRDTAAT